MTISGSQLILGWWFAAGTSTAATGDGDGGTHAAAAASYLTHAVALIRTFFLSAESRMNPNMNFAQGM